MISYVEKFIIFLVVNDIIQKSKGKRKHNLPLDYTLDQTVELNIFLESAGSFCVLFLLFWIGKKSRKFSVEYSYFVRWKVCFL